MEKYERDEYRNRTGSLDKRRNVPKMLKKQGELSSEDEQRLFDQDTRKGRGAREYENASSRRVAGESEDEEEEDSAMRKAGRQRGRSSKRRRVVAETEDLRQLGPFNVDRAPTGQFVPKGSIAHPIEEYPDSKLKSRGAR